MYILNGNSGYTVHNQLWKVQAEVRKLLGRFISFQWERTMTDVMVNFMCDIGFVPGLRRVVNMILHVSVAVLVDNINI